MATVPLFDHLASSAHIGENAAVIARERLKSLMLRAWILAGLFFMALPGTLLGFSNLMAISAHHGLGALPAAWMEGHGHAQVFGWIGSFILGIGFYSQPSHGRSVIRLPLFCFILWNPASRCVGSQTSTDGIGARFFRFPRDLNSSLSFCFSMRRRTISCLLQLREIGLRSPMELWMVSVLIGTAGLASAVIFNFVECVRLASRAASVLFLTRSTRNISWCLVGDLSSQWYGDSRHDGCRLFSQSRSPTFACSGRRYAWM